MIPYSYLLNGAKSPYGHLFPNLNMTAEIDHLNRLNLLEDDSLAYPGIAGIVYSEPDIGYPEMLLKSYASSAALAATQHLPYMVIGMWAIMRKVWHYLRIN